jgi:hypothetical protein
MPSWTDKEWNDRSRRGEVCRIIGCHDAPTSQCPTCHVHSCYQHIQSHLHIITDVEIERRENEAESLT